MIKKREMMRLAFWAIACLGQVKGNAFAKQQQAEIYPKAEIRINSWVIISLVYNFEIREKQIVMVMILFLFLELLNVINIVVMTIS